MKWTHTEQIIGIFSEMYAYNKIKDEVVFLLATAIVFITVQYTQKVILNTTKIIIVICHNDKSLEAMEA